MRRRWRRRSRPEQVGTDHEDPPARQPFREFVYLDDVSLRSLLASQKGELTDQVTELLSQADEGELAGTIGAASPVLRAEVRSRYQTTASQGTQTSRRAVVQSLFKELLELDWIEIPLRPEGKVSGAASVSDLVSMGLAVSADALRRGTMVEVEVELVADPIFRFSTIASELTELANDFPEMLDQPGAAEGMATLVPGNRFLQRFLAGLVPVRARSTSHVVIEINGTEHVVPSAAARALSLPHRPLVIVGVTEQAHYWRDVRRVLFSGSRFTMLCRVARDGLWSTWEPVKLAEVLKEVVPTFPDLLADVGRTGLSISHDAAQPHSSQIAAALSMFIDGVEATAPPGLTAEGISAARIVAAGPALELPETVTGQNEAFRLVIDQMREHGCSLTGDEWLEMVVAARDGTGLALFGRPQQSVIEDLRVERDDFERIVDTEVIAVYW